MLIPRPVLRALDEIVMEGRFGDIAETSASATPAPSLSFRVRGRMPSVSPRSGSRSGHLAPIPVGLTHEIYFVEGRFSGPKIFHIFSPIVFEAVDMAVIRIPIQHSET